MDQNPPKNQDLCKSCGMCCDGTFGFSFMIREEDLPNFTLKDINQPQRCEHFTECGTCGIYKVRPAVCKTYKCSILQKYESEEYTFEEAQEQLKDLKQFYSKKSS